MRSDQSMLRASKKKLARNRFHPSTHNRGMAPSVVDRIEKTLTEIRTGISLCGIIDAQGPYPGTRTIADYLRPLPCHSGTCGWPRIRSAVSPSVDPAATHPVRSGTGDRQAAPLSGMLILTVPALVVHHTPAVALNPLNCIGNLQRFLRLPSCKTGEHLGWLTARARFE